MGNRPFKILGIEHIGIATKSLDGISNVFSDILGLESAGSEVVSDQKVITDIYATKHGKLEFLKAIDEDSPITRFINKNGLGIHHVALKVDNLTAALDYLSGNGIELIDKVPRIGAEGLSIAFLHPRSTKGILIELCEAP